MVVFELILDCLRSDGCDQDLAKVRHVLMFVRSFDGIFKWLKSAQPSSSCALLSRWANQNVVSHPSLLVSLSLSLCCIERHTTYSHTVPTPPYTHNTPLHCLSKAIMAWAATRAVVVVVAVLMAASMLDVASASCANPSPVVLAYTAASGTTCGVGKLVGLSVWLRLLVVGRTLTDH